MDAAEQRVDAAQQRGYVAEQRVGASEQRGNAAKHWAPEICLLFTSSGITANTFSCRSYNHQNDTVLSYCLENTQKCVFRLGIIVDIHYS